MGSFDGAEVCELEGTYILATLLQSFKRNDVGLYRDDGLMVTYTIAFQGFRRSACIKKELISHIEREASL